MNITKAESVFSCTPSTHALYLVCYHLAPHEYVNTILMRMKYWIQGTKESEDAIFYPKIFGLRKG